MSTTRKYGGTGLGLKIVNTLINMMGGKIKIISEEGKGTEFIVTCKLNEAAPIMEKNITPIQRKYFKDKKILIIDNNKNSLRILGNYCKKSFMNVICKISFAEFALDFLLNRSNIPDIILSDINLPGMNGYELARKIREKEEFRAIKLIAITERSFPGDAGKSKKSGFDAYLSKPVIRRDLIRVIQLTLGDNREEGQIITRHLGEELFCKGIKILVAEDNIVNQKLINLLLKKWGCVVDLVSNGREAVEKVRENSYDLCVLDLQMPVMGGIEAANRIRHNIGNKKLPIIALTASATIEDKEKCLAIGMNDYVTKPINPASFKDKVRSALYSFLK